MPAGVHDTGPGMPSAMRPMFVGCMPSTSLSGSTAMSTASKSTCGGAGCWTSIASTRVVVVELAHGGDDVAVVASSGRWTCGLAQPSSAAFFIFMPTYRALASSSPTSTVASPGVWPFAFSFSMRGSRSANTASATGPPGITPRHVTESARSSERQRRAALGGDSERSERSEPSDINAGSVFRR